MPRFLIPSAEWAIRVLPSISSLRPNSGSNQAFQPPITLSTRSFLFGRLRHCATGLKP